MTFGSKNILLCFPALQLSHVFILADVSKPIIGADVFLTNNLIIDIPLRRLTSASGAGVCVKARLCGLSLGASVPLDAVLDRFPSGMSPTSVYNLSLIHI